MSAPAHNALGSTLVWVRWVDESALYAARRWLGSRTDVLAVAGVPARGAGFRFLLERLAAVGNSTISHPKRNGRAFEEDLYDV